MVRHEPILPTLLRDLRRILLGKQANPKLAAFRSPDWMRNLEIPYREVEQLNHRELEPAQVEARYLFLTCALMYQPKLVNLRRLNLLIRLVRSAAVHRSSAAIRYQGNNNRLRDEWLRRESEKLKGSDNAKAERLAKNKTGFTAQGFKPIRADRIRKILAAERKLGTTA